MGLFLLEAIFKGGQQGIDVNGLFQLEIELIRRVVVHGGQVGENAAQVDGVRPVGDSLNPGTDQVGAAHQLVHGAYAQFCHDLPQLFGDSLEEDTYVVNCQGGGGQSFGAFIPKGLTIRLEGDANDYFGKGLSGGKLIVKPEAGSRFVAKENIIIGNVALYGATGGKAFINGMAGERFAVRNSGAWAVVEGVGDHGCEYMTGGRVVVLGPTGKNFAAGMSGGIAYVWDEDRDLYLRLNKTLVSMDPVTEKHDIAEIRQMLTEHVAATGSPKAKEILAHLDEKAFCFKKILPRDYDRMMRTIAEFEDQGMTHEQAEIEAFYVNTRD